jgi:hypothetical protein
VTTFYCLRFETLPTWKAKSLYLYPPETGSSLPLIALSQSQSYVTTDGQSTNLSWNKAPIWGLRPDFYYCMRVAGLLMWSVLSDERTGLSFTIAAGPRQRSNFLVRVPWDSWPYFAVSNSRLPFLSPSTTHRATVEVFDSAFTRLVNSYPFTIRCGTQTEHQVFHFLCSSACPLQRSFVPAVTIFT